MKYSLARDFDAVVATDSLSAGMPKSVYGAAPMSWLVMAKIRMRSRTLANYVLHPRTCSILKTVMPTRTRAMRSVYVPPLV